MTFVLDAVDLTIRELLLRNLSLLRLPVPPGTVSTTQIGFQPPDKDWRTVVRGLGAQRAVNVYLVDLRENRRLRSNEPVRTIESGVTYDEPAPLQLDCHYLVTAWSPATELAGRTAEEHELLSEVLGVLAATPTIVARTVFTPGGLPTGFPTGLGDAELPVSLAPPEGFVKLPEFWGTMTGSTHPWKPAVHLVVTVPVTLVRRVTGPPVTTMQTDYLQNGHADSAEALLQIGGRVHDASFTPPELVPHAWVQLEDAVGNALRQTWTNHEGEFVFSNLEPGSYRLRTRADGRAEPPFTPITVPSPSGDYDLQFP